MREGHTKVAKALFGKGGQLSMSEEQSSTELCDRVRKGDIENVAMLVECGCPVDSGDYDKRTCLHLACSEGNLKMVNILFDYGARLDVFDRWGGESEQSQRSTRNEMMPRSHASHEAHAHTHIVTCSRSRVVTQAHHSRTPYGRGTA